MAKVYMISKRCNISLSRKLHFSDAPCTRMDRYRALQDGSLRVVRGSGVRSFVVLGVCGVGQVISLSNDIDSTVASRFKHVQAVGPSQAVIRPAFFHARKWKKDYGGRHGA